MKLNISKISGSPSGNLPFEFELDLSALDFPQVEAAEGPLIARGQVRNVAGALELNGTLDVNMSCICDRCLRRYELKNNLPVTAYLANELQDEENPDIFLINGDEVDLDEVFTTAFVLSMDSKFICGEDCEGLCPKCGANLNDGPCGCTQEIDSRLAVLEQLLDIE